MHTVNYDRQLYLHYEYIYGRQINEHKIYKDELSTLLNGPPQAFVEISIMGEK